MFICPTTSYAAPNVRVTINGVDGELLTNIRNSLSLARTEEKLSASEVARLHQRAVNEIGRALQPFGYYQPEIDSRLEPQQDSWQASYRITLGPAVIIDQVTIDITGPGRSLPPVQPLLNNPSLKSGDQLSHATYANYKQQLYDQVFQQGYLDATFTRSELQVNVNRQRANILLTLETGAPFFFGEVVIEQSVIEPQRLQRLITVDRNTPFNADRLLELQLALSDTGYFSQVDIDIQKENAIDQRIPVIITAKPAKRLKYSFSLGYGTDTGPRVGFSILDRRVNQSGHSAQYNMRLSAVENTINSQYKIPIGNFYSEFWDFYGGGTQEQVNDIESLQYSVGTSLNQNRWGGRRRLSLTLLREEFSFDDEPQQVANLLIPGITFNYSKSDNTLFARRGYSFLVDVHGGLESALSETSFVYGKLTARSVRPLSQRSRLLNRLELGAISSDSFEQLPPSQRFFTGGSQSVRGYGYKDIAPKNDLGNIVGGQYLVTGSIEVDRLFWGNHGAALFYDVGDAPADTTLDLKTAAGFGYRYKSAVGMIRIDIAHPFDDPDNDVRLHISIGPDL